VAAAIESARGRILGQLAVLDAVGSANATDGPAEPEVAILRVEGGALRRIDDAALLPLLPGDIVEVTRPSMAAEALDGLTAAPLELPDAPPDATPDNSLDEPLAGPGPGSDPLLAPEIDAPAEPAAAPPAAYAPPLDAPASGAAAPAAADPVTLDASAGDLAQPMTEPPIVSPPARPVSG
jgi:hypothetical protein